MDTAERPLTLADLQRAPGASAPTPAATLPLPGAVERTFDTPEFAGMTFYEVQTKSALNRVKGMPFRWSINPYRGCTHACSYCFARPTHAYLSWSPLADFEQKIVVKTNVDEVLRGELRRRSWKGEHVALGTNTDPYQRAEGRYRLMPGILEALAASDTPFSILTKGTLITRDLDVLVAAAQRVDVAAALTIGMLDEAVWRSAEPGTPSPRARLDAVARLNAAGIPTGVMLAPIMPGLNDDPGQLGALVDAAVEAGAAHVTPIVLHLRPARGDARPGEHLALGVRDVFMRWLADQHPGLVDRYEQLYPADRRSGTATKEYREGIESFVVERRTAAWRRRGRPRRPPTWRGRPGDERSPVTADPTRTGHGHRPAGRRDDRPVGGVQLDLFG